LIKQLVAVIELLSYYYNLSHLNEKPQKCSVTMVRWESQSLHVLSD